MLYVTSYAASLHYVMFYVRQMLAGSHRITCNGVINIIIIV